MPPSLAELFERAFRCGESDTDGRPLPSQWVQELDTLIKRRKTCSFDSAHVYYSQLAECPWCRIEDNGGPTFFVPPGGTTIVSADRLAVFDHRILELPEVRYADLPSQRLALPHMPVLRKPKDMPKLAWPDWLTLLMAGSWIGCFASVFVRGAAGGLVLAAGTALSLALAAMLLISKQARAHRKTKDDYDAWLEKAQQMLLRRAQSIEAQFGQREERFNRANEDLKNEIYLYRHAAENLKDVIVQLRESQKSDFLRGFLIRDDWRRIPGLNASEVVMLESFGIESANDVDRLKLYGVPGLEPETVMELLQWRRDIEPGFKFNPEHGITLNNVGATKELAVRRFKMSQARKILAGAKQIESLAEVGKAELAAALAQFDGVAEQWTSTAKQCRDFQSSRRPLERFINQSPAHILGAALGVPFVAMLVYLLFGR
ncbi:MAG TPA: hypothetical protein VHE81_13495 [Lacipirellulaceae bacterium]|nr:hypothetical protein [Lacipirellulaceae bacterium]